MEKDRNRLFAGFDWNDLGGAVNSGRSVHKIKLTRIRGANHASPKPDLFF